MVRRFWDNHTVAIAWIVAIIWLVGLSVRSQSTNDRIARDAAAGAQTHAAMCVYKADLQHSVATSLQFLRLTPLQISLRYGPAFAKIPRSVTLSALRLQQARVRSLAKLECPPG